MSLWTETADVVDHVPRLVGRQLSAVRAHARGFHAVADDGEDLAVRGAVLPVRVAQIRGPGIQLFAHLTVALSVIAVAARALPVVYLLAIGDGFRVRSHGILELLRADRDRNQTRTGDNDQCVAKMAHRTT